MDLRSIINNEAGDAKASAALAQQPSTPSSKSQQHPQSRHESSANANKLYSEYSSGSAGRPTQQDHQRNPRSYEYDQSRQQSRHTSVNADYQAQSRTPHSQLASPTAAYQRPPLYPPSAPAPLAQSNNEFLQRSPRSATSYSAQSRTTQSPLFPRTNSGPFTHHSTNSSGQERVPLQTPGGSSIQRQESYPQPSISQYLTSPAPLTPPSAAGPSGGYPPFLQQQPHSRSLSSHSNSTPTSAHSQYNRSPLLASVYPAPQQQQQQQQQSQPGTPLGPPISIHRSGTYPPPQHHQAYSADPRLSTSPYQSRQSLPPPPLSLSQQQSQQDFERRISNESEPRRIYETGGQADHQTQQPSPAQQILQSHVPTSLKPQQEHYEGRRPREQSESVSPKTQPATRASHELHRQEPIYAPQPQPQLQQRTTPQQQPQQQSKQEQYSSVRNTQDSKDRLDAGQKRKMEHQSTYRNDPRDSEPPAQRRRIDHTPDTEGETTTDERSPEALRQRPIPRDHRESHSQTPRPHPQVSQKRPPQPSDDGTKGTERPKKRKRYTKDNIPIWARSWPQFVAFKKKNPGGTYYGIPVDTIGALIQNRQSTPPTQANGTSSRPQSQQPQQPQKNGAGVVGGGEGKPSKEEETSAILGFPWSESIADIPATGSITKEIADFLYLFVVNRNDWNQLQSQKIAVEVEAKLGTLIDKSTNQRLDLPIASEAALAAGYGGGPAGMGSKVQFRSEMPEEIFQLGNTWLNNRVETTSKEGRGPKIHYVHRREIDTFYNLGTEALKNLPPAMQQYLNTPQLRNRGLKVRVSRDQKTGREIARIVKARVADLDVYFPKGGMDCRISVNLEMEYDGDLPFDAGIQPGVDDEGERRKDRLSYKQSGYTVDLTQVSSAEKPSTHELEIEIDTEILVQQGRKLVTGERSCYVDFVDGLVGRVRTLIGEMS